MTATATERCPKTRTRAWPYVAAQHVADFTGDMRLVRRNG